MFCFSLSGCIWYHSAVDDVPSCQTYKMVAAQLLTLQCPVIQVSSKQAQLLQFLEHAFSLNHDQCQISPHNANSLLKTQVRRIWTDIALMLQQIQSKIQTNITKARIRNSLQFELEQTQVKLPSEM